MFYFIKGLSVFRIVTEPCADRFLLLGGLTVALHHTLDVGGFGRREDCRFWILYFSSLSEAVLCDIRETIEQWIRHNTPNVRNFS